MSCKFQPQWLSREEYKEWIQQDLTDPSKAFCNLCRKSIDLSNMGKAALDSHTKGKKHAEAICLKARGTSQQSILMFCQSSKQPASAVPSTSSAEQSATNNDPSPASVNNTIERFFTSKDVKKAEITWALKTIVSHFSYNACADIGDVLQKMFPDSEIAKNFKCGSTKLAYLVCFGIAPYFTEKLIQKVSESVCYVVSFDESLNSIAQEGQMDIIVRYFHGEKVVSQYLDSQFLGHATAKDLLSSFKKGTSKLKPSKMLQVSMDGPNVNLKFINELLEDRKKEDPDLPVILQLGSCSLHVVHGAFATGIQKTGWNLERLLRAIWYIFADSPARRADFKKVTGTDVFGLQFCSTRWVEDVRVAQRAVKIWPSLVTYVKETLKKPKSQIPTVASFTTLREFVKEPLILAKLEVFISTASLVKPFLTKYQTDKPMLPFMTEDLCDILKSLMARFIKPSVLTAATTSYKLANVDAADQSNWLLVDKVDPGFAAKRALENAFKSKAVSPLAKKEFLAACQTMYSAMTQKILERCPLKYPMVRALQALDPRFMVAYPESAEEKMKKVLTKLVDNKWRHDRECDEILRQFRELLGLLQRHLKVECENFVVDKERLDSFFHSVVGLPQKPELLQVWQVIQMLLTLSHGQATVERGFSINSDTLAPNLKTQTLVARRMIYDTIVLSGIAVADFEVTAGLLQSCSHAYMKYTAHLNAQKEEEKKQRKLQKRAAQESELNDAKKKLKKLEQTHQSLTSDADKQALQAEQKSNFTLLAKSNALRQKAKQMEDDIKTQKSVVSKLSASLQNV